MAIDSTSMMAVTPSQPIVFGPQPGSGPFGKCVPSSACHASSLTRLLTSIPAEPRSSRSPESSTRSPGTEIRSRNPSTGSSSTALSDMSCSETMFSVSPWNRSPDATLYQLDTKSAAAAPYLLAFAECPKPDRCGKPLMLKTMSSKLCHTPPPKTTFQFDDEDEDEDDDRVYEDDEEDDDEDDEQTHPLAIAFSPRVSDDVGVFQSASP